MKNSNEVIGLVREATRITWDAIVIGGGPAGAMAALQFARAGLRTLLVDGKTFPREKICGGYLNRRALNVLEDAGLLQGVASDFESEVDELDLICGRQRTQFRLPPGRVVCRTTFDATMLDSARTAGAEVRTGVQAVVEPMVRNSSRCVTLTYNGRRETVYARVVICADGLARTSVRRLPEFASSASSDSRIGIGAVVESDRSQNPNGRITMVVSPRGYVGISRINSRQLNVAAAIEPSLLAHATPAEVATSILGNARVIRDCEVRSAIWRGTPSLTSRPRTVASQRVLLIGDAAGYVEPFTGEGMAAALESAVAIAPLVVEAANCWAPAIAECWNALHRQIVRDRQHTCRTLAWILRRPWATFAAVSTCRALPSLATYWISKTTLPKSLHTSSSIGAL